MSRKLGLLIKTILPKWKPGCHLEKWRKNPLNCQSEGWMSVVKLGHRCHGNRTPGDSRGSRMRTLTHTDPRGPPNSATSQEIIPISVILSKQGLVCNSALNLKTNTRENREPGINGTRRAATARKTGKRCFFLFLSFPVTQQCRAWIFAVSFPSLSTSYRFWQLPITFGLSMKTTFTKASDGFYSNVSYLSKKKWVFIRLVPSEFKYIYIYKPLLKKPQPHFRLEMCQTPGACRGRRCPRGWKEVSQRSHKDFQPFFSHLPACLLHSRNALSAGQSFCKLRVKKPLLCVRIPSQAAEGTGAVRGHHHHHHHQQQNQNRQKKEKKQQKEKQQEEKKQQKEKQQKEKKRRSSSGRRRPRGAGAAAESRLCLSPHPARDFLSELTDIPVTKDSSFQGRTSGVLMSESGICTSILVPVPWLMPSPFPPASLLRLLLESEDETKSIVIKNQCKFPHELIYPNTCIYLNYKVFAFGSSWGFF